jgi:hypothetical protein
MSRVLLAIAMLAAMASADPAAPAAGDAGEPAARSARLERRHAIYVDLLGRAGLWGLGYDFRPRRWLAIGAAASYYSLDGDRFTTLAPYAALYPLVRGPHAAFVQLGPDLVRRTTPSPVPEWNGMTTTRIGAELCAGYEYRRGVLVRAYAMASQGDHLVPWLGISLGWTL